MKRILYIVLLMALVGLAACSKKHKEEVQAPKKEHTELTAYQELELAYRAHGRFDKDEKDKRTCLRRYSASTYGYLGDSTSSRRARISCGPRRT